MKRLFGYTAALLATLALSAGMTMGASPTPDTQVLDYDATWLYLLPIGQAQNPDQDENSNFDSEWYLPPGTGAGQYDASAGVSFFDFGTFEQVTLPWTPGAGPLEYGGINAFQGDPAPVFPVGTNIVGSTGSPPASGDRYSGYFRLENFNVPANTTNLAMEYVFDGGAVVYLDGQEITRLNCCVDDQGVAIPDATTVDYLNFANNAGNEDSAQTVTLGPVSAGNHTLAIQVLQDQTGSSDLGLGVRLTIPGNGRSWGGDFSGDWNDPANWDLGVPNTSNLFAVFDSFAGPHTIWTDQDISLDGIQFDDDNTHNIAGAGTINLVGNNRNASLNVLQGNHVIQARVALQRDTDALVEADSSVTIQNRLTLNSRTLNKTGAGELVVRNNASTGTGLVDVAEGSLAGIGSIAGNVRVRLGAQVNPSGAGAATATSGSSLNIQGNADFDAASSLTINLYGNGNNDALDGDGTVNFADASIISVVLQNGYTPVDGDSFDVLTSWTARNNGGVVFDLPAGFSWDTSDLFAGGSLSVGMITTGPDCDFDGDDLCNISDVNALVGEIVSVKGGNAPNTDFDLTGDSNVTNADLDQWLSEAATENGFVSAYLKGDSNLDGIVNFDDFSNLGNNWQQSIATWGGADFNADGVVDFNDFSELGNNWQQSVGMAAATSAVPEPSTAGLVLIAGLLGMLRLRKRS